MDEKANEKLAKDKVVVGNSTKQKENNKFHYRSDEKIRWTELRLKYLDSLLQVHIEHADGLFVGDSINKLIKKLNSTLIDEK